MSKQEMKEKLHNILNDVNTFAPDGFETKEKVIEKIKALIKELKTF